MGMAIELETHLKTGVTTLCRCWRVTRRDGRVMGFTDHDERLAFDGIVFRANDGLTARNLEQTTGLAIDNSEAMGVLSATGVTEADIVAGRYDGAKVEAWLVNWANTSMRHLLFRGEIGEIERAGGAFKAELRGLTEALNQAQGRTYQRSCSAILGDAQCGVDLSPERFSVECEVRRIERGRRLDLGKLGAYAARWFERGKITILTGSCAGDVRIVKNDRSMNGERWIELWDALRGEAKAGDIVRVETGCDKLMSTCRGKFSNVENFRGFPYLPGEDFLMAYPVRGEEGRSASGAGDDAAEGAS